MAYNGTFIESWPSKYEGQHGIKVQTSNGEFRLWGKGQAPRLAKGTPVTFDARKGNGDSWHYSNLHVGGGKQQPRDVPTPSGASAPRDEPRMIFVTGVVGRAMGGGAFALTEIKALTLAANEAYDALMAKLSGKAESPPPSMPLRPASEADYDGLNDPIDDIGRDPNEPPF